MRQPKEQEGLELYIKALKQGIVQLHQERDQLQEQLCAVSSAGKALVERLAEINLKGGSKQATVAAILYGSEVIALLEAIEGTGENENNL